MIPYHQTRTVRTDSRGLWIKVNHSIYRPPAVTTVTAGDLLLFMEKEDGCSVRQIGTDTNELWIKQEKDGE